MYYVGDYLPGQTVIIPWSTNAETGAALAPSIAGSLSVQAAAGAPITISVAGVTDSRNVNGVSGSHIASISLANVVYAPYQDYVLVLSAAIIDGQTVNTPIGSFSIMNRSPSRLMLAGSIDSSSFTPTTLAFECSDAALVTAAANSGLAGRQVYGSLGNSQFGVAGVIDTSSVAGGKAHFTIPAGAALPAAFPSASRIVII